MNAILVRVGVDQAFGEWNAPVDPATWEYVYVPIPESPKCEFQPSCQRRYGEALPALQQFCGSRHLDLQDDLRFDNDLLSRTMHLDPDFEHLTYGDDGTKRGAGIATLQENDLLVFYAGLRPTAPCEHRLVYALIGFYVVMDVRPINAVLKEEWPTNAHTRKLNMGPEDIVVRAKEGVSGRFRRCIPIGEWRSGAYRVRNDVLDQWGGLSVRDGFIQRSAVPPSFLSPAKFRSWLEKQHVELLDRNFS